ncbi:hypothetical protein [Streptomyces sp. NPDC059142]|uniref:hypothetical protein n=1 Tax=Streptomyces sp. NPDC059142 TaxID=3346739 RepID=UPI0036A0B947
MGAYERDVVIALRERRASTCTCGASNPPHYDACHECQQPLVTCATCGTVSPQRIGRCTECGCTTRAEALGAREEGYELTHEEFVNLQVGPRRVGGRYRGGSNGPAYEVLDIKRDHPFGPRSSWQITVRWLADGRTASHCTAWDDRRDSVIEQPSATAGEDSC